MRKDVEIVNIAGMKCSDMEKATAAACFDRKYELMFLDAWRFFYSKNQDSPVIGGCARVGDQSFGGNLEKYHGVKATCADGMESEKGLDFILSQLDARMPVAMGYDQAYLPWAKEMRRHAPLRYSGNIMITGYERNMLQCIDIHGSQKRELLPFEKFTEYSRTVDKMDFVSFQRLDHWEHADLKEHIEKTLNDLFRPKDGMFCYLKQFADQIKESFDFKKEIDECIQQRGDIVTPNWIDIVADMIDAGRMRALYSLSLKYLSDVYKNDNLLELSDEFKIVWSKWQRVVSILVKCYFSGNYHDLNLRVAQCIEDIIEMEKKLSDRLSQSARGNEKAGKLCSSAKTVTGDEKRAYVNLEQYYNNQGFSNAADEEKADFDGLGNYFLPDRKEKADGVTGANTEYRIRSQGKDNIICRGQRIKIDIANVRRIYLLGACDSAAFFGNFEICFENGETQNDILGFGEWRFPKCEMGERLELVMGRFYCNRVSDQEKGYIFSNVLHVKSEERILDIRLPDCENMHIFAITVSYEQ